MKTIKIIFAFLVCTLVFVITSSCDNGEYYKTFDYSTMTFVEPTSKSDFCIRKISQTDKKIEMEVIFNGNRIKRKFIKEENCWLSTYKYETVKEPFFATIYGEKFEYEYFICNNHIISKQDILKMVNLRKKELIMIQVFMPI